MFEVAYSRKYHSQPKLIGLGYTIAITHRTTGLHYGCYAGFGSESHTIVEGEEGITSQYSASEIETKNAAPSQSLA